MTKLAAIIFFILALIFYAWNIYHPPWTWEFCMLWGFLLEKCLRA